MCIFSWVICSIPFFSTHLILCRNILLMLWSPAIESEIEYCDPSSILFLVRIPLSIWVLCFHQNLKVDFQFCKECPWDFVRDCIKFVSFMFLLLQWDLYKGQTQSLACAGRSQNVTELWFLSLDLFPDGCCLTSASGYMHYSWHSLKYLYCLVRFFSNLGNLY